MLNLAGKLMRRTGAGSNEPTTDPYWANVKLLMHFDGTDGSNNFVDEKGHVITRVGTPIMTATDAIYGSASGKFDNTHPDYLTIPGTDFIFAGDLTIEFSYKVGSSATEQHVIGNATGNIAGHWAFTTSAGNNSVVWWANGYTGYAGAFGVYPVGTVLKIALVRSAGVCKVYVNGEPVGSPLSFSGPIGLASMPLAIGARSNGVTPFTGLVDELRMTDGVARYTEPYTPRKTPFPNSA